MRLWLRLYTEVLNDPKVQKLNGDAFKFWINLLCCAKEYSNDGILPDIEGIAFHLRVKHDYAQKYLQKMIDSGLVDYEANTYIIHSWNTRQYESDGDPTALNRKRKERDRKRDVTQMSRVTNEKCHANVTLTEQIPEQIPDIEKREKAPQASPAPEKLPHGEFGNIKLTDQEYRKLTDRYKKQDVDRVLETMGAWMKSKGKVYKDHYAALLNWIKKDGVQERGQVYRAPDPEADEGLASPEEIAEVLARLPIKRFA